ncbi:MAG: hypothetical protein WCV90_03395 [Candidatus Woesearchaeota archaeon]|jgi:hypothetical protein
MKPQDLISDIRKYLQTDSPAVLAERERTAKKLAFVSDVADLFNSSEMIQLLERTKEEIVFLSHCSSSMGTLMSRSKPNYEVLVSYEGLQIRCNGNVSDKYTLPASLDQWMKVFPYGGEFHDSSFGDYCFEPSREEFFGEMERKVRGWLK